MTARQPSVPNLIWLTGKYYVNGRNYGIQK
jgi:hypothetical protein